jgi:hypothetical protein
MLGRRVTGLVALACALTVATAVHDDVAHGAMSLFAPAYDTVTFANLRTLATALQSYALLEGDLTHVTVPDLAAWGWEPGSDTRVTICVSGDEFRVVAQDVRPGAATFEATGSADLAFTLRQIDDVPPPAKGGATEGDVVIQVCSADTI